MFQRSLAKTSTKYIYLCTYQQKKTCVKWHDHHGKSYSQQNIHTCEAANKRRVRASERESGRRGRKGERERRERGWMGGRTRIRANQFIKAPITVSSNSLYVNGTDSAAQRFYITYTSTDLKRRKKKKKSETKTEESSNITPLPPSPPKTTTISWINKTKNIIKAWQGGGLASFTIHLDQILYLNWPVSQPNLTKSCKRHYKNSKDKYRPCHQIYTTNVDKHQKFSPPSPLSE